ncbi:kinesin-domain-containing protein [Thozetella sp. PMI_491]|nr:kinesin-domain-containing protein [Thozetella sp. PMI_491]
MERRRTAAMAPTATRTGTTGRPSMRPPSRVTSTATRQVHNRQLAVTARGDRSGAISPANSVTSINTAATAGTKRKEREYDADDGESTNINVVVRCRGRNEREVRENSAVVVSAEGVKGNQVVLSMGPTALTNKSYNFDRVFSPAADQSMIFDDVVKPILDDMLAGYNCTIFAYGQTGTGKTYTMSGDMNDTLGLLSDAAGIIPRVLHALFNKLEIDDTDSCVRCSFIELYNEELRDLLSADETAKLKIFDDNSRKGHSATVVQGMEERHITNAADGLKWLQEGSVRRQVAATKCNDLSSRSHTVFTITLYVKRQTENGEDFLRAGKLNLVDLAGSENIQRSGAENKRAAEAGLINKSLLTLGRVINALVDRSQHIPYRESKLTRLLQDSLGGRTKTCIIATISPAKSNLEETISTLDYAFRAKNIRNKPQINPLINKEMLLREFTLEIERLRSQLITTRQRNGVYMSNDAYEEMTVQNESRRILVEEQGTRIETLESNLRNKGQELFALTSSFMGLKKDHEGTKAQLDDTKEVLDQTELVLAATRKTLAEETRIRKAHQDTEEKLIVIGGELISSLDKTVEHVEGLHAKNKRKSDLHGLNRSTWTMSQSQVSSVTELVEGRIEEFRAGQERHISTISERMQSFIKGELSKLSSTQAFLDENLSQFAEVRKELVQQNDESKEEMDDVLEEIKVVRDNIKERVGESLQAIAGAAETIAADVLSELTTFHTHLHTSYSSLGQEFKSIFQDLTRHITAQKSESDRLRHQLEAASEAIIQANADASARIKEVLDEERKQAASERHNLLTQITALVNSQAELQESRLVGKTALIQQSVLDSTKSFEGSVAQYSGGMDSWNNRDSEVMEEVAESRDALKTMLKEDWAAANDHSQSIQNTTKSVHAETIRVVDEQIKDLDTQMKDLDDFVTRARLQNSQRLEQHDKSIGKLSETVEKSYSSISTHFTDSFARVEKFGGEVETTTAAMQGSLNPVDETICRPLADLREDIQATMLQEYEPTGETPEKMAYQYPASLPQTEAHEALIASMADAPTPTKAAPPSIFNDLDFSSLARSPSHPPSPGASETSRNPLSMSLREVNPNLTTGSIMFDPSASIISLPAISENATLPLLKRSTRTGATRNAKKHTAVMAGGRENLPPSAFSESLSRRKSPRLH